MPGGISFCGVLCLIGLKDYFSGGGLKKVGFIIIIILAPEIGIAITMDQHLFARESQEGRDVNRKENVNKRGKIKEDSEIGETSKKKSGRGRTEAD